MNYHNITTNDMLNGDGLRVVLWVSGCEHNCPGCHNPETHDPESGILFDREAKEEIFRELEKDHIAGITLSGGDPMALCNRKEITQFVDEIKKRSPKSTIWMYTGYDLEELKNEAILKNINVIVDGRYEADKKSYSAPWVGSTNQKINRINE